MIPVVRRTHSAFPDSSTRAQISFAPEHCHTMASAFFSMAASIMDTRFSGSTSSWGMAIVRSTPDYPLSAAQIRYGNPPGIVQCLSLPVNADAFLFLSSRFRLPGTVIGGGYCLQSIGRAGCQAQGRHTSQQDSPQGLRTEKEHIQHKMPYALLIFYF